MLRLSQLTPLFANLSAGLISGLVNITYSLSYAALIFPGELSPFLPFGITCTLMTACVTGAIVALRSSLSFIISGPDSNAAAILAVIVATIAQNLTAQESDLVFPTIWLTIILTTFCTGLFLWTLGRLHLGRFIRFIPYPVVGGFLAGLGWLFVQGAFSVMTGISVQLTNIFSLFAPSTLLLWLPGILLGITLQVILTRSKHFLTFPVILLSALISFYAGLVFTGTSFSVARDAGLLFSSLTESGLSQFQQLGTLFKADWSTLGLQFQSLITLLTIVPITILLNATGLEMATQTDVDLDQELETAGIANIVTGLLSGIVGHFSISRSLLNYAAGGRNRLSGLVAALFCALFLLFGTATFNYLPRFLFGGLLFYLGLSLLIEWVYQAWFRLSKLDCALVLIMLLTISRLGLLQGVGIGLLIACLLFVVNYSNLCVIKNVFSGKTYQSNFERSFHQRKLLKEHGDELVILRLQGYIFFGTANSLLESIHDRFGDTNQAKPRFLILDFLLVVGLDSSAVVSFLKIKQLAEKTDVTVILTSLSPAIAACLHDSNVISDAQLAVVQTNTPPQAEPEPEPEVVADLASITSAASRRKST
ncbi:SulP family inorganic anion transporter [Trichothermofontia sp.]